MLTSYGFWYPKAKMDVYLNGFGDRAGISYFSTDTEPPGKKNSLIPFIDSYYYKLSYQEWKEKVPIINLLFSPGFMFFVWIVLFAISYLKNGKRGIAIYFIIFATWSTFLLGPTYLVRYVFFLWTCFPIALMQTCVSLKKKELIL